MDDFDLGEKAEQNKIYQEFYFVTRDEKSPGHQYVVMKNLF